MTFTEALDFKRSSIGDSFEKNGLLFNVYVAPLQSQDLNKFLIDYNEETFDDNSCLSYSSDNQFKIHWIMAKSSRDKLFKK